MIVPDLSFPQSPCMVLFYSEQYLQAWGSCFSDQPQLSVWHWESGLEHTDTSSWHSQHWTALLKLHAIVTVELKVTVQAAVEVSIVMNWRVGIHWELRQLSSICSCWNAALIHSTKTEHPRASSTDNVECLIAWEKISIEFAKQLNPLLQATHHTLINCWMCCDDILSVTIKFVCSEYCMYSCMLVSLSALYCMQTHREDDKASGECWPGILCQSHGDPAETRWVPQKQLAAPLPTYTVV